MKNIAIQNLLLEASNTFNVDIHSNSRQEANIQARAVVYSIMRDCLNMTYQSIGKVFKKNHATIMHGYKELPYMIKYNKQLGDLKLKILKNWGGDYNIKRYTKRAENIKDLQDRIFLLNLEKQALQQQIDTLQK